MKPTTPSGATDADVPCFSTIGVFGDRSCDQLPSHVHCLRCPVFAETASQLFDRRSPVGYREEWTARLATPDEAPLGPSKTYVTFRVGAEWLAMPSAACVEVTEVLRAFPLAHRMGGAFEGLVNVRGQALLCVSLRKLLDIAADVVGGGNARLVVVAASDGRYALRVDEVDHVRRILDTDIHEPPATLTKSLAPHVHGVVHDGDSLIGVIEPQALFASLARCVE